MVGDVELVVLGFLVRFVVVVGFDVLVVGTTDVCGVLGPDSRNEMAQIATPIRTATSAAIVSSTSGLRYHGTRDDGRVIGALSPDGIGVPPAGDGGAGCLPPDGPSTGVAPARPAASRAAAAASWLEAPASAARRAASAAAWTWLSLPLNC
ncbi:hypothetical protein A9W99_08505 [Mycobacterium sp. 1164966.3]|nr:hypothetical protein A9W99_08505 [Mycobacterium sp. 1164966.3]